MAKSISYKSGSPLIGSPIIITVTADTISSLAVFHQVKLKVKVHLSSDYPTAYTETILSSPCENGGETPFDISSILRAAVSKYEYKVLTGDSTYPYLEYSLSAWDDYMIEGTLYDKENVIEFNSGKSYYAIFGAATGMERYNLMNKGNYFNVSSFSRKPNEGEVCAKGEIYIYAENPTEPITITSALTSGPSIKFITLSTSGLNSIADRSVYVDDNARNRILFQFVNGLGCIETVSAITLPTIENTGSLSIEDITVPITLSRLPRLSVSKQARRTIIKCSTGPVNREWANWWINEFMGSDPFRNGGHNQCWVLRSDSWLPCIIIPDDDMKVVNETEGDLISLDFEVRIAIDGAI